MIEQTLVMARLIELMPDLVTEKSGGKKVDVQFNPESMKVTRANSVAPPRSGDQSSGIGGLQYVGEGSTKLALSLWFDVTAMTAIPVDDVRRLTANVIYFMTPREIQGDTRKIPPGTRFSWGSFIFDGIVDSLEETLEFFSPAGKPLRASLVLTLSQQKFLVPNVKASAAGNPLGQRPFTPARQGQSLQQMLGASGETAGWQSVAAANAIEDPLRIAAGTLIDLNAGASSGFARPGLT